MAIIAKVPAITTALAIHGFMAKHRSLFVLRMQSHQGVVRLDSMTSATGHD